MKYNFKHPKMANVKMGDLKELNDKCRLRNKKRMEGK